jgi:pyridoxamine 5'-phosphate oxidase
VSDHDPADLARRRNEYETAGLDVDDVAAEPLEQWQRWYAEAVAAGCVEPHAFVLATVDDDGVPQSRYLLARGADQRGVSFFTNYESAKSRQMAARPDVSMLFTWLQLHRQVRVVGRVERLAESESDAYFATRPRSSQIGAWASPQSTVIDGRSALDQRVAEVEARFNTTPHVPRPPFWGGWLLRPRSFEFWQGRPSRLHDRLRYTLSGDGSGWSIERLAP